MRLMEEEVLQAQMDDYAEREDVAGFLLSVASFRLLGWRRGLYIPRKVSWEEKAIRAAWPNSETPTDGF